MKNSNLKMFFSIIILILFTVTSFLQADVFMKRKVHQEGFQVMGQQKSGGDEFRSIWITKDKMRSDDENHSIIIRLDQKKIYILDNEKRTYTEMPLDFGKQMSKKMKEEMSEEMSEEDMQNMMQMTKGMMKMEMTVTPTGETRKIGQWNCRKYKQQLKMMMGTTTSDIWATEDIKMDYDLYAEFSAAMTGMQPGMHEAMGNMIEEMKKIKGVPVLTETTVNMMGQNIKSSEELVEYKEESAPAGIFEIPKGYKKTEGMNFKQ